MRRDRTRRPAGFTLLEMVIALALGGVVLLGVRLISTQLADTARRLDEVAAASDRTANGERLLRALVGRMEIGTSDEATFGGDEREARFTSWCEVPAGWLERCQVALTVLPTGDARLAASMATGRVEDAAVLVRGFGAAELRYLSDAGAGGTWFRSWGRGITAPLAIGIVLHRDTTVLEAVTGRRRTGDTLIVRIGERG